jgi:N-methylhydantoinase A
VGALREITVERGLDPREFSILAFGGAGPMLAPMLAREMGIPEVVVPREPGVFSAWGMLAADLVHDEGRATLELLEAPTLERLEVVFEELGRSAAESLLKQGIDPEQCEIFRRLDLRYVGQEYDLGVRIGPQDSADSIRTRFDAAHRERHGHNLDDAEVEIVAARVRGVGRMGTSSLPAAPEPAAGSTRVVGRRLAYDFATRGMVEFGVYRRDELARGDTLSGPALVQEPTSVTVIHSDQRFHLDQFGHLVIAKEGF